MGPQEKGGALPRDGCKKEQTKFQDKATRNKLERGRATQESTALHLAWKEVRSSEIKKPVESTQHTRNKKELGNIRGKGTNHSSTATQSRAPITTSTGELARRKT